MSDELEIRLIGTRDQVMAAHNLIAEVYDIVADQGPLSSRTPGKVRFYLGVVPRTEQPASDPEGSDDEHPYFGEPPAFDDGDVADEDRCDGCGYRWSVLNQLGHEIRGDDCGPPEGTVQ